jgi:outer membrane protein assembly factor BamB
MNFRVAITHGAVRPSINHVGLARPTSISALISGLLLVGSMPAITPVAADSAPRGATYATAAPAGVKPTSGTPSTDWPQFRAGPGRLGYQTETKLSASNVPFLGLAWEATVSLAFASSTSPSVAGGVVYTGQEDGKLYAYPVGCNTGGGACTPLWTGATGGYIESSPVISNGVVYVGSADNYLYAYAVGCASGGGTCTPIWKGPTGGGVITSSPTVVGGVVYVGSGDGNLYAYAVGCGTAGATCTPIWKGPAGTGISFSSPAVINGMVYVGSDDGNLYAFQVGCGTGGATCSPWFAGPTGGPIYSTPAVTGGEVYVGSSDHKLYAFSVNCNGVPPAGALPNGTTGTCTPDWTATTGDVISSSPAVIGGVVYVGSEDGKIYAYGVGCGTGGASCTPIWKATTGGPVHSSPAVANGVIYVGSDDHKLYAYRVGCNSGGGSCSALWTYTTGGDVRSSPAVSDGVVYVGSWDGKLYAFSRPVLKLILIPSTVSFLPGGSQAFGVEGFDAAGNDLGDFTTDTTFDMGRDGACTDNVCTSLVDGTQTVTATSGDGTGSATVTVGGTTYHPLSPVRLLDTRIGNGLSGKFAASVPRTFQITGRGGVPAGATAVTANVTIVKPSATASVYLGPDPIVSPTTATISFNKADITAYGSTIALDGAGEMSATYMATIGSTDLLVDVTGFFTADSTGATYHPLTPARLLDTRHANGLSGKFVAGVPRGFPVWGRGGVPTGATAVTGNLTVVNSTNAWAVYLGPDKIASPGTSTINFAKGQIRANSLTVPLSIAGSLAATFLSSAGNKTDLVFDVTGYYTADLTGARFVPLAAASVLDTQIGTGLTGKFTASTPRTFGVWGNGGVPNAATGVTGIVSVHSQSGPWAVFVGPLAIATPTTSALNFLKGDNCSNGVTVALSPSGSLSVTYLGSPRSTTNVVFVVTGYFVP